MEEKCILETTLLIEDEYIVSFHHVYVARSSANDIFAIMMDCFVKCDVIFHLFKSADKVSVRKLMIHRVIRRQNKFTFRFNVWMKHVAPVMFGQTV